jgi:hypothetical protein
VPLKVKAKSAAAAGSSKVSKAAPDTLAVADKKKKKRSGSSSSSSPASFFSQAPLTAFMRQRADAIWHDSGLFANDLTTNAVGKAYLAKHKKKHAISSDVSINKIYFAGDVPAMIRSVVENVMLARYQGANVAALDRVRRTDGSLPQRNTHVTGADLDRAAVTKLSTF